MSEEKCKLLSIAAYLVLAACVATLVLTHSFFGTGLVSVTIQILAAVLMIWARVEFGRRSFHAAANPTQGGLVRSGPYRYLRHPIYAAIFYALWAGIAVHLSVVNVLIGVIASATLALRIYCEEVLLRRIYKDYVEYARRTARILPFVL